jgi:hypothetical protein
MRRLPNDMCRCQGKRIPEAVIESEIVGKKSMPWSDGAREKRKSSRSRSEVETLAAQTG